VETEDLSQQIEALASPSKPPEAKKPKKGGEGGFLLTGTEITEIQE
jgi:hypothetical protein